MKTPDNSIGVDWIKLNKGQSTHWKRIKSHKHKYIESLLPYKKLLKILNIYQFILKIKII